MDASDFIFLLLQCLDDACARSGSPNTVFLHSVRLTAAILVASIVSRPISMQSLCMLSVHLFKGLSPMLGNLVPSILVTCPRYWSLLLCIRCTMFSLIPSSSFMSWLWMRSLLVIPFISLDNPSQIIVSNCYLAIFIDCCMLLHVRRTCKAEFMADLWTNRLQFVRQPSN